MSLGELGNRKWACRPDKVAVDINTSSCPKIVNLFVQYQLLSEGKGIDIPKFAENVSELPLRWNTQSCGSPCAAYPSKAKKL